MICFSDPCGMHSLGMIPPVVVTQLPFAGAGIKAISGHTCWIDLASWDLHANELLAFGLQE